MRRPRESKPQHPSNRNTRSLIAAIGILAVTIAVQLPGNSQSEEIQNKPPVKTDSIDSLPQPTEAPPKLDQTTPKRPTSTNPQDALWYFLAKNGGLQGGGTLLGALIGFGGLIWATSRGYRNLINAQKEAAVARKVERQEQVRLDTQTLALALFGEVNSIKTKCEIHHALLKMLEADWKERVASDENLAADTITIGPRPQISATIYESNASRLGMLGIPTIERVVDFYSRFIPYQDAATAPDGKLHVRYFVQFVDAWVNNLTLDIELAKLTTAQLGIIATTGDWHTVSTLQEIGKQASKS